MLNKIILKGTLGYTPRIKHTQQGKEMATFSLATRFSWKDKEGEWQTHVDWHCILVFREATVNWLKDILKKGDTVYVEGSLFYHLRVNANGQSFFMPYIVVGQHGQVTYLHASSTPSQDKTQDKDLQEQDPQGQDPQGQLSQEEELPVEAFSNLPIQKAQKQGSLRSLFQGSPSTNKLNTHLLWIGVLLGVLCFPQELWAHTGDLLKDEIEKVEKLFTGGYMRLGLLGVCGFAAIVGIIKQNGWIFASGILGCAFAYFMKNWILNTFTQVI